MTIQLTNVTRAFVFNGVNLNDPGPDFSPDEVRDIYSAQYPDLVTAVVGEPAIEGDTATYTFVRNVGTKGGSGLTKRALMRVLSNANTRPKDAPPVFIESDENTRCTEAVLKLFKAPSRSSRFLRIDPQHMPPVF